MAAADSESEGRQKSLESVRAAIVDSRLRFSELTVDSPHPRFLRFSFCCSVPPNARSLALFSTLENRRQ